MKIKTSELIGPALDWAVAKCEGIEVIAWNCTDREAYYVVMADAYVDKDKLTFYAEDDTYYPSTSWAQGGPILEQWCIDLAADEFLTESKWMASCTNEGELFEQHGPTPLIAAMRCYVASRLGDEVDVPEELTTA